MPDYYDAILAAIAAALTLGAAATVHPAVATYQGLGAGSLVATALLFETLFRNPPTEPTPPDTNTVASVVVGIGWAATLLSLV